MICFIVLTVFGCASMDQVVRASSYEDRLYRHFLEVLQLEIKNDGTLDAEAVSVSFRDLIVTANVSNGRAAAIQYEAIRRRAGDIKNADQFSYELATLVFKNDPVSFLMAVGYGDLANPATALERKLYDNLIKKFKPLATRNAGVFSATYKEKSDIAAMIARALEKAGLLDQKALMVLHQALNDTFGKTSLYDPQLQMLLRFVYFEKSAKAGSKSTETMILDQKILDEIEFVEILADAEARGWDDKAPVLRLLQHYFGNLALAINFVLEHGWGAANGSPQDSTHIMGKILYDFQAGEILNSFGQTRWSETDFDPKDPSTYRGSNGLVFNLLFPAETPRRNLEFPVRSISREKPKSVEPAAKEFESVLNVLGSWENIIQALQISSAELEPYLIASMIYLQGRDAGWGQLLLAADIKLKQAISSADIVFGKGEGLSHFFSSTKWRQLSPGEQIASLAAESSAQSCIEGYRKIIPILIDALDKNIRKNRIYVKGLWADMPAKDVCNVPGGGMQLFVQELLMVWASGNPLTAVNLLAKVLEQDKAEVFELLADARFAGMSRDQFVRKYVLEDIDAKREFLQSFSDEKND